MTESEWFASTDPLTMMRHLRHGARTATGMRLEMPGVSERKLKLWIESCRAAADRAATASQERFKNDPPAGMVMPLLPFMWLSVEVAGLEECVETWTGDRFINYVPAAQRAAILRDIFGNPFSPVTIKWVEANPHYMSAAALESGAVEEEQSVAWITPTVLRIAQAIHDEQAFDRMPILADALEDAGCTEAAILEHCRGNGTHVVCQRCCGMGGHIRVAGEDRAGPANAMSRDDYENYDKSATEDWRRKISTDWKPCPDCKGKRPQACGPHVRGCWVLDLVLGLEQKDN